MSREITHIMVRIDCQCKNRLAFAGMLKMGDELIGNNGLDRLCEEDVCASSSHRLYLLYLTWGADLEGLMSC
jgi:hypothetical protein